MQSFAVFLNSFFINEHADHIIISLIMNTNNNDENFTQLTL